MYRPLRSSLLLLLLLTLIATPGCDAVQDAVNDAIPDVDVPLGSAGDNLPVAPGAAARSTDVDGEDDLPSGFDVANILLEEDDVTYTPVSTTGKTRETAASGSIFVAILIDRVPAVSTTITIVDDAVTDISPSSISIGQYDGTALAEALENLEDDDLIRDDYASLSSSDIQDVVNDALVSDSFQLSVIVHTSSDLLGTLDIDQITIDVEV